MCFDDHIVRNAGLSFQAVNVLREQLQKSSFIVQQLDEAVSNRRFEFSGIKFVCKCVEGQWVVPEVGYIEDGFRKW